MRGSYPKKQLLRKNMKQLIAVKKLNAIVLPNKPKNNVDETMLLTFNAELMRLGYILTKEAFDSLKNSSKETIEELYEAVLPTLKTIKGDNVAYKPMYPNFPKQVMEAKQMELLLNAVLHYWSNGVLLPDYEKEPRAIKLEKTSFHNLKVVSEEELDSVFAKITSSKDSISEEDSSFLQYFINERNLPLPSDVPFKETLCFLAGQYLNKGVDISPMVKTATDILRIITSLSGGDISLASNTKFKSMPRAKRRMFINLLEKIIREEDVKRHEKKWNKVFHALHVGEYPCPKVNTIAKKLREGKTLDSFNTSIEMLLLEKNVSKTLPLLETRAGEFARRIHQLLSLAPEKSNEILERFATVVDSIPTRNLTQLLGATIARKKEVTKRVVFPKGKVQKAQLLKNKLPLISAAAGLEKIIEDSLIKRFKKMPSLGKVFIENNLFAAYLPTQQRSASSGAFNVARGTRIPLKGDQNTLRFFIYWEGQDIDLSATLYNEDLSFLENISYTNLKSKNYSSCHSGDITYAPEGASEFIDITMDEALAYGARYVVMDVRVFSGPTFNKHSVCYAGWMRRESPQSNEIYDPKTVEQKVNLTIEAKTAVPVIFDLKTKEAIWVDVAGQSSQHYFGNNVESNKASLIQLLKAFQSMDNKLSLGHLLSLHAKARGELVAEESQADQVFSFEEGTPFDVTTINSEFLK